MESENIHIQANKVDFNYHIFLLFIPAVIFVVIMAIIMRVTPKEQVLGNTTEQTQTP